MDLKKIIFFSSLSIAACSNVSELVLPSPTGDRTGTEILYLANGDREQAQAISLETDSAFITDELEKDGLIYLEAMVFTESPEELGVDPLVKRLPDGIEGWSPREVHVAEIRDGVVGSWTPAHEPSPPAARYLPANRSPFAHLAIASAHVFPALSSGAQAYFIGAFAIDAHRAMVVTRSDIGFMQIYLAEVDAPPSLLGISHPSMRVTAAVRSRGVNWLAGFDGASNLLATVNLDQGVQLVPGEAPRNLFSLAEAREGDRHDVYALDYQGGAYGYSRATGAWTELGATDTRGPGGSGLLARAGDAELLAVDPLGCGLHHVPDDPTEEETPIPKCEADVLNEEPFVGLNDIEGIGALAGTLSGKILHRDPLSRTWRQIGPEILFFDSVLALSWFEKYRHGVLIGASHGSIHQCLFDGAKLRCNSEQVLTVAPYGYVERIVTLEKGWVVAGPYVDPNSNPSGSAVRQVFISSLWEVPRQ